MATSEPVLEVDRSESFTNGLLLNLWDMKTRGYMTDMTIIAANVRIPCHRVVMEAASEHFRELSHDLMRDVSSKEIELNFDEVYIQKVVEYCYTGKITIDLSAAKANLRIVEYFQLSELKAKIEEFVCDHVSPETCIAWYSIANEFRLPALDKKCRAVVEENFKEVSGHADFHELSVKGLIECIKSVEDANTVLEACFNWVDLNILGRSKDFLGLLSHHIRLDQCSPQCVEKVLQNWKATWPHYTEVQEALKPFAPLVPKSSARPIKCSMFLFGGYTQAGELNNKMWEIDLSTGTCKVVTTIDQRALKFMPGYCATPDKLFVIGGSRTIVDINQFKPVADCHSLAVQDAQCEAWPDVNEPLAEFVAVCVNDHIYTFGGDPNDKAVYRLNLKTRKWSRCPDMPVGNVYPIIAAIGCLVYMIFNTAPYNEKYKTSDRVSMYCFDTSTLTWTPLTPLPVSINHTYNAIAVSVGEDLYLVGGLRKLCARYSPVHKTWKTLQSPKVTHRAFSAVHMDGDIVLCGGFDENGKAHAIIEVYNIAQDAWKVHSVRMPMELAFQHCSKHYEAA